LALNLISQIKKKTLVIVHKEFLINQWIERIEQFVPDARVGKIQGATLDIENKDIVVGMLQSLSMKEYEPDAFNSFGFTIVDECFPYDTLIITSIGKIKIGKLYDKWMNKEELPLILSFNEKKRIFEFKKMNHSWEKKRDELIEISVENLDFSCTPEHKILTDNRGYVKARDINKYDKMVCHIYNKYSVTTIKNKIMKMNKSSNVYDIEVEGNHNFIVTNSKSNVGIVCHNCHHIGAEVFSRALPKINSYYSLGLSATPSRPDGLSKVFNYFLGPIVYRVTAEDNKKIQINVIKFLDKTSNYNKEELNVMGKICLPKMINNIVENKNRNLLILLITKRLVNKGKQTIILSDRRDHLKFLYNEIEKFTTVGYYVGGMKQKDLKKSESCNVILGTYPMSSEGLDIPSLDAAIFATPKSSIEQSLGRITRKVHDDYAIAYDIVDDFSLFPNQLKKRTTVYNKQKCKIYEGNMVLDSELNESKFEYFMDQELILKEKKKKGSKKTECLILDD